MPKLTAKRRAALNRRADGTFGPWKGGARLKDLPKQENTFQGIAVHIGKEFSRQHGRTAKVGECVRTKKADGSYHQQAEWYVRTVHGWRKHGPKKPTAAELTLIRQGRSKHRKGTK